MLQASIEQFRLDGWVEATMAAVESLAEQGRLGEVLPYAVEGHIEDEGGDELQGEDEDGSSFVEGGARSETTNADGPAFDGDDEESMDQDVEMEDQ